MVGSPTIKPSLRALDVTECMTVDGSMRRIFLAHNACLNASYDLNLLSEGLRQYGFTIVERPEDAEEAIFSGCAVREVWVEDAARQLNAIHARAPTAQITIVGCVSSSASEQLRGRLQAAHVRFGSQSDILAEYTGLSLNEVDSGYAQGTTTDFEGTGVHGLEQLRRRVGSEKAAVVAALQQVDREHGTALETFYRQTTKGFVFYNEIEPTDFITVTRSCLYKCSFCTIPRGRGEFTSVPLASILRKARASLARGVSRLVLVGDEVGNYGVGKHGPKFQDLVRELLKLDARVRLSIRYIEPKPFVRHFSLLERHCSEGRIELLYVSLQSGSQRILNAMNRKYRIEDVAPRLAALRKKTDTVFYTNWLVGFPGETDLDYRITCDLVNHLSLQINVAIPFSPRPGTAAMDMVGPVDEQTKTERVEELSAMIGTLKVSHFASHIGFLPSPERHALLQMIKFAESKQYREDNDRGARFARTDVLQGRRYLPVLRGDS